MRPIVIVKTNQQSIQKASGDASQDASHNAPNITASKKQVRILHLINGEHFSGAERVQDLLALALPQFGFEVGFVCLKPDKFPAARQSLNCELFKMPMRWKFDVLIANKIARMAREKKYDLLHAHTPRTLMIGRLVARKLKCPLVYHVHSPVGRDSNKSLNNRLNTWIETWSLRGVDRMICVSNSLAEYMIELGNDPGVVSVVKNGVEAIGELPARNAPGELWTLGTMALFRPRKGTEVLFRALAILKSRNVNVHLRAVGPFENEDYETEILELAKQLGIEGMITWTGFQTDVNSQLSKMDLFVLPSLYGEGLPMVVLEAMANAIPVVASRVEGIPEAVRDGVDGLIFEPGSAEDLADKIESIVRDQNRWCAMSQSSLQRQRADLSDMSMARGVAEIYHDLLGRP